jgi:hypothetical protein
VAGKLGSLTNGWSGPSARPIPTVNEWYVLELAVGSSGNLFASPAPTINIP